MTTVLIGTTSAGSSMDVHNAAVLAAATYASHHGIRCLPQTVFGSNLAVNENTLAKTAMDMGVDYWLSVENDVTFPEDAVVRLVAHGKDIVGATTLWKEWAPVETYRRDECRVMGLELSGQEITVRSLYEGEPLREVMALPLGCLLISTKALRVMDDGPMPIFFHDIHRETKTPRTTDLAFCERARSLGFSIWLDAHLTREVSHWGIFPYRVPPVEALRTPPVQAERDGEEMFPYGSAMS